MLSLDPVRLVGRILLRILVGIVAVVWLGYTGTYFILNGRSLGSLISNQVNRAERGSFILTKATYPYWGGLVSIFTNWPVPVVGEDYELRDPDNNLVLKVPRVDA